MSGDINIISKLDTQALSFFRRQYLHKNEDAKLKTHSMLTGFAFFATVMAVQFLTDPEYAVGLWVFFTPVFAVCYLVICVQTPYYWRTFFQLKREGVISYKNLFFEESAGLYRKLVFFFGLAVWLVLFISDLFTKEDLAEHLGYALRSDFYREAGIATLDSFCFSVVAIEFMRLLSVKNATWSAKRHLAYVVILAMAFSTLRVAALGFVSGHGIF